MHHIFPRFYEAIIGIAPTDEERAQVLGVHRNTIQHIKSGGWSLRLFKRLPYHPALGSALCEDLEKLYGQDIPPA